MVEKKLSRCMRLMCGGGLVAGAGLLAQPVYADDTIQRVEITGSSIKRIAQEGALPIQTLTRKDIEQSGASSVADLVANLPAMQGFVGASSSVDGKGGGVQTASVHAIGTAYTLVLLNGRRMAPYGTGSAVNLASIPLSAVERVEILTDGASTLYGSDAIAGVVNFILKKNQTKLDLEATLSAPQQAGGQSANVAISKGFGNLDTDGYNVLLAYSHDQQKLLDASQRGFGQTGVRKFSQNGSNYATWQTSINSLPGNADIYDSLGNNASFSPDLASTGKCHGANTFALNGVCRYDYAATVELLPELKRDSLFASANAKLGADSSVFAELVLSNFSNTARYAAAAQPLTVFSTDPVSGVKTVNQNYLGAYNASVVPLLPGQGIDPANVTDAFLNFRGRDAGGRTDTYQTVARHFAAGFDSSAYGWDYSASMTHSESTQNDKSLAGYMSGNAFDALVRSGAYNPFVMNANGAATLAPAVLRQNLEVISSKIDVLGAHASRELFALAGGKASLGVGADMTRQTYADRPSEIMQGPGPQHPDWTDVVIGGSTGSQTLEASRKSWGTFGEVLLPILTKFDLTAALRYDSYEAVHKANVSYDVDGNPNRSGVQGEAVSKLTYKLSARYQPVSTLLLRASYGTGFKAPTMNNISDPLKNAGASNFFACPITAPSDVRFAYCRGVSEYGLLTAGNPATGMDALKPEESVQSSLGFRLEPGNAFSLGMDFWDVKLSNQIQTLSQDLIYNTPALADKYISLYYDPIQKSKVLVSTQRPLNLASSHYRGIDLDATAKSNTALGKLTINGSGTYMLKAEQAIPGGSTESSVGRFDSYDNVTLRVIARLQVSLKSASDLTNTLTLNYRSGYHDKVASADDGFVRLVNADGSIGDDVALARDVAHNTTLDYQLRAGMGGGVIVTGGIKNVFNVNPPLSIRNSGGGDQVGYDGRYADPLGRTFYLRAAYRF